MSKTKQFSYLSILLNFLFVYNLISQTQLEFLDFWPVGTCETISSSAETVYFSTRNTQGRWHLLIADCTDLNNPIFKGKIKSPGVVKHIMVRDNILFTANGDSGLRIIDISNPSSPNEISSYENLGYAQALAIKDDYVYIADNTSGIQIINISDPYNPVLAGAYIDSGYSASDIVAKNDIAYAIFYGDGMKILDISNPASPQEIGSLSSSNVKNITIDSTIACLATNATGVRIVDISNPSLPISLYYLNYVGGEIYDIILDENTLFVLYHDMYGYAALKIYDISVPTNPVVLNNKPLYTPVTGGKRFSIGQNGVFMALLYDGVNLIDTSNYSIKLIYDSWSFYKNVDRKNNYAYVTNGANGIQVFDISEPIHTKHIGGIHDISASQLLIEDNLIYAGGSGLRILDIANSQIPIQIGSISIAGGILNIQKKNDYIYCNTTSDFGLTIFDVSDPTSPILVDRFYAGHNRFDKLLLDNDILYLAEAFKIYVVDISNPIQPIELLNFYPSGMSIISDIEIIGHHLFVVGGQYMVVYDISSPDNPIYINTLQNSSYGFRKVSASPYSDHLITLDKGMVNAIRIFDVSDVNAPYEYLSFNMPIADYGSISMHDSLILFPNGSNGFYIFKHPLPIISNISPPKIIVDFNLMQNYPNPFNPNTTISYTLPAGSEVELTIFNILGQKTKTLVTNKQIAGSHEIQWDGRNEQGENVSSGIYLYSLKANGHTITKKMVLLR